MLLASAPMHYAGGGFPWGFLIIGVLVYLAWRNGLFDGFGRQGGGPRYGGFGSGFGPTRDQGNDQTPYGPRAAFEEWHRQAHEAERAQSAAPASPPAAPPADAGQAPPSNSAL